MLDHSIQLQSSPPCQVLVAGGGIAGVYAALGAGRQGANTLLIEQHAFVGGQGTAGGVHNFSGDTRLINDVWRDMIRRLKRLGGIGRYRPVQGGRGTDIEALKFVLQEMLAEAGVRLLLHTQLVDVEREGDRIVAAVIHNKSGLARVCCEQVIDATGDADVVARGGWAFRKGGPVFRPGNPPRIDPQADSLQLPMSLYFTMVDTKRPVTAYLPDGCPHYASDDDLPMTTISGNSSLVHGVVHEDDALILVKFKVVGHDATDGESLSRAEQEARRQMMGVVYHLQTKGYQGRRYDTFKLAWVAPHIGVREGRRVVAEYEMTARDVLQGRHFEDAVGVGSYHVDYHWPADARRAGTGLTTQVPPYQIPLRAMRPRGAANVLVPGRCMSGEQLAMSSFRVMTGCAHSGFAAGTAAGHAAVTGRLLSELDLTALRTELRLAGVRLDLAPYYNFLRQRRVVREPVIQSPVGIQCRASTLAQLPSGDVVCAWFGGTREGADDTAVWASIRHEERWCEPFVVARHPGMPSLYPVLFLPDARRNFAEGIEEAADRGERLDVGETDFPPPLYLYYHVGKTPRNWMSYRLRSDDGGRTWSEPEALPSATLGPIKNKAIRLTDGSWLAPSSAETNAEWSCVIKRSEDEGRTWTESPRLPVPGTPRDPIQPTLWESSPGKVHALMQSCATGHICRSDSTDGGRTWSTPYPIDLVSNNWGLDIAVLNPSPGDPGYEKSAPAPLALVFNQCANGRTPLVVAVSYDNGATWPHRFTLEDEPGEFSYPAVVPTADGIALSYTWKGETIIFWRLSLEHLRGERGAESLRREVFSQRDKDGMPWWVRELGRTAEESAHR